jgi:hypothetical protein
MIALSTTTRMITLFCFKRGDDALDNMMGYRQMANLEAL